MQATIEHVVMPTDANYHSPLIFGGAFMGLMDLAAAYAVRRCLYDSETCKDAVTHKYEGTFHKPAYVGDLLVIKAVVVSLGKKSLVVEIKAYRETSKTLELMAESKKVFVSVSDTDFSLKPDLLKYAPHGITIMTEAD